MNKRLFLGIPLPDNIQKELETKPYSILQQYAPPLKIVPLQNQHLTLYFLGQTPSKQIPFLIQHLQTLEKEKEFTIGLTGIGSFHHRVIWLGVQQGKETLKQLHCLIAEALQQPVQAFNPHLTLARVTHPQKQPVEKIMQQLENQSFSTQFLSTHIHLIESRLEQPRANHYSIHQWRLAPAAAGGPACYVGYLR